MNYADMNTTIHQLVDAIRAGDKKAQAELESRAKRNGKDSRAAKALEALKTGGAACYAEFFAAKAAEAKAAPKVAKATGVKGGSMAHLKAQAKALPAAKAKATGAKEAVWAFTTKSGQKYTADSFARVIARATELAVHTALK